MLFAMSVCRDKEAALQPERWFFLRPSGGCDPIQLGEEVDSYYAANVTDPREMVLVAQMPHVRSGVQLAYSVWFQYILALLSAEISYSDGDQTSSLQPVLQLQVRLGYKRGADSDWTELASDTVSRHLHCSIEPERVSPSFLWSFVSTERTNVSIDWP